jgi:hypothetical protein
LIREDGGMSSILKMFDQQAIQALAAKGFSLRWISRDLNINRRKVARYAAAPAAKCTTAPGQMTDGSGVVKTPKCTTLGSEQSGPKDAAIMTVIRRAGANVREYIASVPPKPSDPATS